MKILVVHNRYKIRGGEDEVVRSEVDFLRRQGHVVAEYVRDNHEIDSYGAWDKVILAFNTTWARKGVRDLREIVRREKPHVAHFHNTFPLISPAAYFACAEAAVPVVQTLHNYRSLCPAATFFREGHVCEDCAARIIPWPSLTHACYRDSTLATAAVAAMHTVHRALRTWQNKVDCYIALSDFAREVFIRGGLPAERIRVKPNAVHPDPGAKNGPGEYALFVGRLCQEKGVRVLMSAWAALKTPIPLIVAGDGPLKEETLAAAAKVSTGSVELLGAVSHSEVLSLMRGARFLVFPSLWYEACPLSLIEAFACGLPVIGSRIGALEESIAHGQTGLHFSPGNFSELATLCDWAWHNPDEMQAFGRKARAEYKAKYTPEQNYPLLIDIYQSTIEKRAPTAHREKNLASAVRSSQAHAGNEP